MEALPARGESPNKTAPHAHHAIQITLSLGGRFELTTKGQAVAGDAAVAADVEHVFAAQGHIALLFVEPESKAGRAIANTIIGKNGLAPIPDGLVADLVNRLSAESRNPKANESVLKDIGRALVGRLAGLATAELPDPRVRHMMDYVASRLDGAITLGSAAKSARLSPSRARHLFVEQTGLPFRSYLLWLRIMKAVGIISGGSSLTEAAHEAGFADSAHFSRTFKRMFGLPAAALQIE